MTSNKLSGQSVADRLTAAKHSIAGHGLAKTVCKATTEEVMGPKKKHVDYLIACTNEPNVSIPSMANLLIERTQHQSWVVVFKSLIAMHNVMNYGNERFTQYLASNNCTLSLAGFRDKTGVQGYDMSTFIQRYARYLNEKAVSYRTMAFDFCKVKRGKDDGLLRTMNTEKLLKTLPVLQHQLDILLEFDCTPNELTNGVINACFMLMFKDLIRLFACYNDGIINLLEKYFEMNKKQCKEGLDIYKKFLVRMERVSEMLKVAENVGIDKGDIPDLAKAPSSLLEALEEHLRALEGKKGSSGPPSKPPPSTVTSAINSLAGTPNPSSLTEDERRRILEEENKHLQQLKERKESSTNPFAQSPTENSTSPSHDSLDFLGGANSSVAASGGDVMGLATTNPFAAVAPATNAASPWGNTGNTASMNGTGFASEDSFAAAFGSSVNAAAPPQQQPTVAGLYSPVNPPPGFDGFGEVMRPSSNVASAPTPAIANKPKDKFISGDLDSSLMSLAGNLNINGPNQAIKKHDHQWGPASGKQMTGGTKWGAPMGQPLQPSGPAPVAQYPAMIAPSAMTLSPVGQAPVVMLTPMTMTYATTTNGWGGMGMMPAQAGMMPPTYQQAMPMGAQQRPMQPAAFGQPAQQQNMFGQPAAQQSNPNDPFGAL